MNGISFMLVFGPPFWKPIFDRESTHIRMVFGPVAFWIMFQDMDIWICKRAEKESKIL